MRYSIFLLYNQNNMFKKVLTFVLVSFLFLQSFNVFADYKDVLKTKIDQSLEKVANNYTEIQQKTIFPTLIKILEKKEAGSNQWLIDYIIEVLKGYLDWNSTSVSEPVWWPTEHYQDIYGFDNIDMQKFKEAWLVWLNKSRAEKWLSPLDFEAKLDITAQTWAKVLSSRHHNWPSWINRNDVHKRNLSDSYYDYWKITSWMKNNGVVAKNVNSITFTENIGYGIVRCPSDWDCTNIAISSSSVSYQSLYVKEKAYNGIHYRGLMKKEFQKAWFWFVIDDKWYYWIVIHYATEVE